MNQLPRSIDEHIKYLQRKGMSFPDKEAATDLFSRVSYSRLKYYWRDLIEVDSDGVFKDGTTFSTIIGRYAFDHQLRVILFDASDRSLNTQLGFMTKSHEWEYENEVRLIQYKANNGQVREQYALEGASKIVAVYFGYRCPESNIQIVKKLLSDREVKFYKMAIDYNNVYKLTFYEV